MKPKRRLVPAFIALFLLIVLINPSVIKAANSPKFTLSNTSSNPAVGDEIKISVAGEQLTDLYGYEVNVTFDSKLLKFVKMDNDNEGFNVDPILNENKIKFAFTEVGNKPGKSGSL